MNKATFSRLIVDSTYLSDADVLALEQVVQAFPYCQTAHMLLAKAASDKGSMLAPQRLRKAAIHAPSRALLKKLVEGKLNQIDPARISGNTFSKPIQPVYNGEIEDLLENDLPNQAQVAGPAKSVEEAPEAAQEKQPAREAKTHFPEDKSAIAVESETPDIAEESLAAINGTAPEITVEAEADSAETAIIPTLPETEEEASIAENLPEELAELTKPEAVTEPLAIALKEELPVAQSSEAETAETEKPEGLTAFLAHLQHQPHLTELEAPELQPDLSELGQKPMLNEAEAAAQNLEAEPADTTARSYPEQEENPDKITKAGAGVLAGLVATESEITVTPIPEILAEAETEEKQLAKELTPLNEAESSPALSGGAEGTDYSDSLIISIFRDNELGYAMSSSRMGESLQPKSELTREVPFHFQPELLVEYRHTRAETEPVIPEQPTSIPQQDLINDFLKQASKTRPRANMLPKAEEQEDLSQKSTRLSKSIVSENLAQIFAMQGKTKKAIKIYQQLQLKMPEKKDYFAVLINKLQNQSS